MNMIDVIKELERKLEIKLPIQRSQHLHSSWKTIFDVPLSAILTESQINAIAGLLPKINNDPSLTVQELKQDFPSYDDDRPLVCFADPTDPENVKRARNWLRFDSFSTADVFDCMTCLTCNTTGLTLMTGRHIVLYQKNRPITTRFFKGMNMTSDQYTNVLNRMMKTIQNIQMLAKVIEPVYIEMNRQYDRMYKQLEITKEKLSIFKESM